MKTHVLRSESITPIAVYLELQRTKPDSYAAQLDFAAALLYREREYRAMNSARWHSRQAVPAPSPESPFQPFDITPAAAADLAAILADRADELGRNDLFGLKDAAADGLRRVLRAVKSHEMGWLVLSELLTDLRRYSVAVSAADQAAALGARVFGPALASRAALLGEIPRGSLEASKELNRKLEAFNERVRKLGVRVRTRVEGDGFTRFLSTVAAFCEKERDAALESFEDARVPSIFQELIPLARQIGVGDDGCRAVFIARMRAGDRREAAARIREHGPAIDAWLSSLGTPPYDGEAAAFFWLLAAADELD